MSPAFRKWNLEEFLPAIACPLALVHGEDDEFGTTAQLGLIESRVTRPTHRLIVAKSGNSPHLSQSARIVEPVSSFLADPK